MIAAAVDRRLMAMKNVRVLVVIADGQERPIASLVNLMEQAGLTVTAVMDDMGLVRGCIADANLAALRSVPGVVGVEEEEVVQLAPPHSGIQ